MRIGLNLLPVRQGIGGTWSYIGGLLGALAEHDHRNEYVVFATGASVALVPSQANFTTVLLPVPSASRVLRVLYENSLFRRAVARARLDCLHHVFGTLPSAGAVPTVVSMYDLIEFERPTDFNLVKRSYLRIMRRRAARQATIIAPMSHATANDIQSRLGVPRTRIEVVLPPLAPRFTRQRVEAAAGFRARYGLPDEFWLAIADALPRKNYGRLLTALAELRRGRATAWPLCIRGEPTRELLEQIAELGLNDAVSFVPRLSDGEMPLLYSAASALVFPSVFEGGGLPVVEAIACGCPVVASNIATTLEFAGDAALTFDPMSIPAITRAMRECETDEQQRATRVETGLEVAMRLRPAAVAAACIRAYERAVASPGGVH